MASKRSCIAMICGGAVVLVGAAILAAYTSIPGVRIAMGFTGTAQIISLVMLAREYRRLAEVERRSCADQR